MRVTLIHNRNAGQGEWDADDLVSAVGKAGHEAMYCSTDEADFARALEHPADLMVAVGGDGTVARVAKRLAERGVLMAMVPAGTANNIAASLGVPCRTPAEHVERWAVASRHRLNVGRVTGDLGEHAFVESVGCGLFVEMMLQFDRKKRSPDTASEEGEAKLRLAREELRRVLADAQPREWRVEIDGTDFSGSYLLVEAMNIRRIGPGLVLAPDADPGDGLLDVVFVREDPADRAALNAHLDQAVTGGKPHPDLTTRRARDVVLSVGSDRVHVDDEALPRKLDATLRVRLRETPAVDVLV
jgi:diacylglycerol kinase (ATP)